MRLAMVMAVAAMLVGGTGCAARRAEKARARAAAQAEFYAEWEAQRDWRDQRLREWVAAHPGERVPWALRRNKPLYGYGSKELRYSIVSEYMSDRIGAREEAVFEDPPCVECRMGSMKGRRYVKSCLFLYNDDRSQTDRLYVKFEDGRAIEWDID